MRQILNKNTFISITTTTVLLGLLNLQTAQTFLVPVQQNLWPILSEQFTIHAQATHANVQKQVDQDLRHPNYIHTLTENARPYLYGIVQEAKKLHVPVELALLPMVESSYHPSGTSQVGAAGLWQLMPSVADQYGVKMNFWYDGRRSTTASTKVALTFLSKLYRQFHDNWLLALAAYNAGPGTVMHAIRYNKEHGKPTDFWALPLPKQTEAYVPKLLALATIIKHPHTYHVRLAPVPDKSLTKTIKIDKQTRIKTIAKMAHTTVSAIKKLNPDLKHTTTPPDQIIRVMLPLSHNSILAESSQVEKEI